MKKKLRPKLANTNGLDKPEIINKAKCLINEYIEVCEEIENRKQRKELLKESINIIFDENNLDGIETETHVAAWGDYVRWDYQRLKRDMDIPEEYKKITQTVFIRKLK